MEEIEGRAKSYPTELYAQLMKTVVPLRREYRQESTLEGRQQIAQTEF